MEFAIRDKERLDHPKRKWHNWFAWFPVRVSKKIIWLERIQRKGVMNSWGHDMGSGSSWVFEYKKNESYRLARLIDV